MACDARRNAAQPVAIYVRKRFRTNRIAAIVTGLRKYSAFIYETRICPRFLNCVCSPAVYVCSRAQ